MTGLVNRRGLLAATASIAAVSALPQRGRAETAATRNESTYRLKIGDIVVTTLNDGYVDFPANVFQGTTAAEIAALNRASFRAESPIRLPVNAFLVANGDQRILIDTGAVGFAPTVGLLGADLAAAGVAPAEIHTVLITHLHADHTNGLLTADGKAAFPNAELVVSKADYAFWTDAGNAARAPEGMKLFFQLANAALAPYAGRIRQIDKGMVAPGIEAVPLYGHTPGHTGYRVSSGSEQMLIWTDIVHATALQFAKPEITIAFDVDPAAARDTRKTVMDMAATDRLLVAGSHLEFPGVGHVVRSGDAYAFVPAPWTYDL